MVLEKKTFDVFPIVSLWELLTPRVIFDPRGMVGSMYKEDHYTLLHTKNESSGPCGFGEEIFFLFSHDRIYKDDHYTFLHTKYESSGPCGFGEEDFFMFFP